MISLWKPCKGDEKMQKKILLIDDVEYIGFILRKNLEKYEDVILTYIESGEKGSRAYNNGFVYY